MHRYPLLALAMGLGALASTPALAAEADPRPKKKWTVMFYGVGDDRTAALEDIQIESLRRLLGAPAHEQVEVVAQIDRSPHPSEAKDTFHYNPEYSGIQRYVKRVDGERRWVNRGKVATENAADPATLYGFLAWAAATYPAENYALIMDGHGSGIITTAGPGSVGSARPGEVEPYPLAPSNFLAPRPAAGAAAGSTPRARRPRLPRLRPVPSLPPPPGSDPAAPASPDSPSAPPPPPAAGSGGLFGLQESGPARPRLSPDGYLYTGLTYDSDIGVPGARDAISFFELAKVLEDFEATAGTKLGLLTLYNCLGGSAEGIYQIRDGVRYVTATPTVMQFKTSVGHDPYLAALAEDPGMGARELAKVNVTRVLDSAVANGTSEIFAAWDMEKIPGVATATAALVEALFAGRPEFDFGALRQIYGDYWDLRSFAIAAAETADDPGVSARAAELWQAIRAARVRGLRNGEHLYEKVVVKERRFLFFQGKRITYRKRKRVGDLSVYFPGPESRAAYIGRVPREGVRAFYRATAFAADTRWGDWIDLVYGLTAAEKRGGIRGSTI